MSKLHVGTGLVAAGLGLLIPGAGHFYIGRPRRFLFAFVFFAVMVLCLGAAGVLSNLAGFATMMVIGAAVVLFGIVDALVQGVARGRAVGWAGSLRDVVLWGLCVIALSIAWAALREPVLGYGVYRLDSTAMKPTFEVGDLILVNTRRPAESDLAAGSVVMVRHPRRDESYVRRLKGRSGEDTYALEQDWVWAARDPELETIERRNVVATVRAVVWSPQRRRIAFVPERPAP